MRRISCLVGLTLLSGCSGSGFYRYERDTFTLPGANPNRPALSAPNYAAVVHDDTPRNRSVLLTDAGDIWPPPPTAIPTLKDMQLKQRATLNAGGTGPEGMAPLPTLPSLPGYEISMPDPSRPAPETSFPRGVARIPYGSTVPTVGVVPLKDAGNGAIVVPNGNGTSTVIAPNGAITTVPTPKN